MSKRNLKWDGQSYLRTFIFWDTLMVVVLVVVAIGVIMVHGGGGGGGGGNQVLLDHDHRYNPVITVISLSVIFNILTFSFLSYTSMK